jgi:hypothetical protein
MKSLLLTQIKPNPFGKDRSRHGASAAQLGAEWVDFKNAGTLGVPLDDDVLYHRAFSGGTSSWKQVMTFSGTLAPGKIVRVHAGRLREVSVLRQEDIDGAHHHLFTGEDQYIWNNAEGDTAGLWDSAVKQWIDQASYDPNPPEGVILVRSGDKFVSGTRQYAGRY